MLHIFEKGKLWKLCTDSDAIENSGVVKVIAGGERFKCANPCKLKESGGFAVTQRL